MRGVFVDTKSCYISRVRRRVPVAKGQTPANLLAYAYAGSNPALLHQLSILGFGEMC